MSTSKRPEKESRYREWLRDAFLGGIALMILYDQVFLAMKAQPILIFLVIFLFGCIPFLRGDKRQNGTYSPFVRIIMAVMGVKLPDSFEDAEKGDGTDSEAESQPSDSTPGNDGRKP